MFTQERNLCRKKDVSHLHAKINTLYDKDCDIHAPHVVMELDAREWKRLKDNSVILSNSYLDISEGKKKLYNDIVVGSNIKLKKRVTHFNNRNHQ